MKRLRTLLVTGSLVLTVSFVIGVSVRGQQTATFAKAKTVKQGSDLPIQITLDRAASISGFLDLEAAPVSGGEPISRNCGVQEKTATCAMTLSLEAKTGAWKFTKVVFVANSGGVKRDLTPLGDLTFEVTPHEKLVLPSQATFEIR